MNTKTPATGLNDDDLYLIDVQRARSSAASEAPATTRVPPTPSPCPRPRRDVRHAGQVVREGGSMIWVWIAFVLLMIWNEERPK